MTFWFNEFVFIQLWRPKYPVELCKTGIKWKVNVSTNRFMDLNSAKELQILSLTPFLPMCHDFSGKSYGIIFSCSIMTKIFYQSFCLITNCSIPHRWAPPDWITIFEILRRKIVISRLKKLLFFFSKDFYTFFSAFFLKRND